MALTTCVECSGTVSSAATACPHCGSPMKPELAASRPAVVVSRAVLALLCVVPVFVAFPAGFVLAAFPALPLLVSFWRPQVATIGLAALVVLWVLASLLS